MKSEIITAETEVTSAQQQKTIIDKYLKVINNETPPEELSEMSLLLKLSKIDRLSLEKGSQCPRKILDSPKRSSKSSPMFEPEIELNGTVKEIIKSPKSECVCYFKHSTDVSLRYSVDQEITRRNKTGSSQVGAISKAPKYSKNNYWKHLENLFFFKKNIGFFFRKNVFFLESRTMPKNSKRGHSGPLNVFTNRKLQKNARGYLLIESQNFRKSRIVRKKTKKKSNERKPLVSHLLLEA